MFSKRIIIFLTIFPHFFIKLVYSLQKCIRRITYLLICIYQILIYIVYQSIRKQHLWNQMTLTSPFQKWSNTWITHYDSSSLCARSRKLLLCLSQYLVERQLCCSLIIISLFAKPAFKKHSMIRNPNRITFPYFLTSPIITAHILPFLEHEMIPPPLFPFQL